MYNVIDETLPDHPKCELAAGILETSVPAVIGHLNCLWLWAMKHAQDGDLTDFTPELIATAAKWKGDPEQLIDALVRARHKRNGQGFLERDDDGGLYIHHWEQYGGKLFADRCKEAKRLRDYRARQKAEKEAAEIRAASSQSEPVRTPALHRMNDVRTRTYTEDDSVRTPYDPAGRDEMERQTIPSIAMPDRNDHNSAYTVRTPVEQGTYAYDSVRTAPKHSIDKLSLAKSNTAGAPAREGPPDQSPVDVVALLCSSGVSEEIAGQLAAAYPEAEIRRQVEWLPFRQAENPGAMVVKAIKGRWEIPPRAKRAQQRAVAAQSADEEWQEREDAKRGLDDAIASMTDGDRADLEQEALRRLQETQPIVAKRPGTARDALLNTIRRQVAAERTGMESPRPAANSP